MSTVWGTMAAAEAAPGTDAAVARRKATKATTASVAERVKRREAAKLAWVVGAGLGAEAVKVAWVVGAGLGTEAGKEVWVVGAQNAGKSSIINRLSRMYGGPGPEDGGPLASHLPGTTLGVVRLENLLPNGSDVFDTPGLLQPFQVSSRLDNEEARMVLPRRRLQPRTYRAEIGSTIHIGGLARIDATVVGDSCWSTAPQLSPG